jgi:hypothetical protein
LWRGRAAGGGGRAGFCALEGRQEGGGAITRSILTAQLRERVLWSVALVLQAEHGLPVGEPDHKAEVDFAEAAEQAFEAAVCAYAAALEGRLEGEE